MKYHDILGIPITANELQINDAFDKSIESLSGFESTHTELYSRRVQELSKARDECLEYISMPFSRKMEIETKECIRNISSPNVLHSWCCCGDGCGNCCICIVVGAAIGGIGWIGCKCQQAAEANEQRRNAEERSRRISELNARFERERDEAVRLNNQLPTAKSQFQEACRKHEKLKTRLEAFETQLSIINRFLEDNNVNVDLKETSAYRSLYQQESSASNEEYRSKNRITEIESELDIIREHEDERQRYLRNNNYGN